MARGGDLMGFIKENGRECHMGALPQTTKKPVKQAKTSKNKQKARFT